MRWVRSRTLGTLAAVGLVLATGCTPKGKGDGGTKPSDGGRGTAPAAADAGAAIVLTGDWNTPDGMVRDAEGNILVSMPNFNDPSKPASIVKIDKSGKISEWFKLPPHPQTKFACPLGLAIGSDGNLYWADNQDLGVGVAGSVDSIPDRAEFAGKNISRLCRVVVENGKPVRGEVVVEGFFQANGLAAWKDAIYVCETSLGLKAAEGDPHESGVYMFELKELDPAKPIQLETEGNDEHLIYTLETKHKVWKVGANGLAFGADGTMYVCNFGDATIMAVKLDEFGNVEEEKALAQGQGMKSCDGLQFDKDSGLLYCADFLGNAVHEIDPETGKVRTVRAESGNNDGTGNKLDKPSECHRRGDKIYVANIDLPFDDNKYDEPHTISVIDVK
ncbi:MAG: SMP-30/gluconolactonase/LRE family protein [Planctomycetota bacterium]|jgi:sugar lactone lactonase YvrE